MELTRATEDQTSWPSKVVFDPRPNAYNSDNTSSEATPDSLGKKNARLDTCRSIVNAIGGITVLGPEQGVRWRGQASIAWRLNSGATRQGLTGTELDAHESEMIEQARRRGMDNAQHLGDWEILARFRHNGAATRLIDITTDPFVALFMLCDPVAQQEAMDKDGLLIAVNRTDLNEIRKPWMQGSHAEMVNNQNPAALVYATPPIDPRIAAQRGEFMLSTSPLPADKAPLCELFQLRTPQSWNESHVVKILGNSQLMGVRGSPRTNFPNLLGIRIPARVKPTLLTMLKSNFGFTRESIYPDWSGLAEGFRGRR